MPAEKPADNVGTWNPDLYLRYADYRARPAKELIARLKLDVAGDIYDLGCGPGNLTQQLRERWPDRRVVGVDSSPEMLASARKKYGDAPVVWQHGDIATWKPERPAALIFSNAAYHWLHDHATLLPRLMGHVAPGGVFAMQMPATGEAKYQACIRAVKNAPRWKARLAGVEAHDDPHAASVYYDLIAPLASETDVWETNYWHVLGGEHPVTDWIMSTGLVPILSVLDETGQAEFLRDYNAAVDAAYPRQVDGTVLLDMRRIFLIARRKT